MKIKIKIEINIKDERAIAMEISKDIAEEKK